MTASTNNSNNYINTIAIQNAHAAGDFVGVMQLEDEHAKRKKILASMTPALRDKLAFFESWLFREVGHVLRNRYELGQQVLELYNDEKQNGAKLYGKNAIGRICKILRWDDGTIRMALRFAQTFTQQDVDRICSLVLPGGAPVTWSHIRTLLAVSNRESRIELLDKTVANGWTSMELAEEIVRNRPRAGNDERGRPPKHPNDFDSSLAQIQLFTKKWDRQYSRVWSNKEHSLSTNAADMPADKVDVNQIHELEELAYQLRRLANQAKDLADAAEKVAEEFRRILAERQQAGS